MRLICVVVRVGMNKHGSRYSPFPATHGDTFGSKHAATKAEMPHIATGAAALLAPFSSMPTYEVVRQTTAARPAQVGLPGWPVET